MTQRKHADLSHIITPELLQTLFELYFPFHKAEPLDAKHAFNVFFLGGIDQDTVYDLCFEPALRPLSEIELADFPPDLTIYLPPPAQYDFPIQALGLVLLLDQVPRRLLSGVNSRWTNAFFDVLAHRTITKLLNLPWSRRPDNLERWIHLGYSLEHASIRRFVFYFPLTHSEEWADHMLHHGMIEQLRRQIENHRGSPDPSRSTDRADAEDPYAFTRIISSLETKPISFHGIADFFFLYFRILRVHEPVIRRYGRYPYRNGSVGREFTESEKEYMRLTEGKFAVDDETARAVKEDVRAGRWTPLQGRASRKS